MVSFQTLTGSNNLYLTNEGTFGTANVIGDPRFVDAANGDFHLQADSPAIDTGTATQAFEVDLDNTEVPQGDAPDIGAYEFE